MIDQEWWRGRDESTSFKDELAFFMAAKKKARKHKLSRKEEYLKYLSSPEWTKRALEIKMERKQCEFCGAVDRLEVHHLFYKPNFKAAKDNELIVLCSKCHVEWHKQEASV